MRTLSSTLLAEIGATYTQPLWLVQIKAVSTTYRLSSWDQPFSWNSFTWQPAGIDVDGLSEDGKLRRTGRLLFTDADITWWTLALNDELTARPVDVWKAYAGAPNEAIARFSGRTGGPRRDSETVTAIDLINDRADTQKTPRDRIGLATGVTQMAPAGSIFYLGGVKYTLVRPTS